jgi:hypothetical protein
LFVVDTKVAMVNALYGRLCTSGKPQMVVVTASIGRLSPGRYLQGLKPVKVVINNDEIQS